MVGSALFLLLSGAAPDAEARPQRPFPRQNRRPGWGRLRPDKEASPDCDADSKPVVYDLANALDAADGPPEASGSGDDACEVASLLAAEAAEAGIPLELAYATAWTESRWQQWDDEGEPLGSATEDYGLMQINAWWAKEYDWDLVLSDTGYNIGAGVEILAWSYNYAKSQGYSGTDLLRAAYAVYNGGPDAVDRPWDSSSAYHSHDQNFLDNLNGAGWEASIADCK